MLRTMLKLLFTPAVLIAWGSVFITGMIAALIFALPLAWVLMILLGILHSQVAAVPALGFLFVWPATFGLKLLFAEDRATVNGN